MSRDGYEQWDDGSGSGGYRRESGGRRARHLAGPDEQWPPDPPAAPEYDAPRGSGAHSRPPADPYGQGGYGGQARCKKLAASDAAAAR